MPQKFVCFYLQCWGASLIYNLSDWATKCPILFIKKPWVEVARNVFLPEKESTLGTNCLVDERDVVLIEQLRSECYISYFSVSSRLCVYMVNLLVFCRAISKLGVNREAY